MFHLGPDVLVQLSVQADVPRGENISIEVSGTLERRDVYLQHVLLGAEGLLGKLADLPHSARSPVLEADAMEALVQVDGVQPNK